MISERQLAHRASFWSAIAPMLDAFVRVINMDSVKFAPQVLALAPPEQRAFVGECAFELGRLTLEGAKGIDIQDVARLVDGRLALLDRTPPNPSESIRVALEALPEIRGLATNLVSLANKLGGPVKFAPEFLGCGYMSRCAGDMLVGACLVEVKSGKRSFRSEDLRQLVVYTALNYAGRTHDIDRVALVNPREGAFFQISLSALIRRIASTGDKEFFERFVFLVSGAGTSG